MLISVTPDSRDALRRAVDLLDAVDDGALVEIKTEGGRVQVMVITNPDGRMPECADQVFAAAFDLHREPVGF